MTGTGLLLLAGGASMSDASFFANPDDTQTTPLHWAALQGDLEKVQALVAAEPRAANAVDSYGWTPLHWAAAAGQAECAAVLVKAGASLEARGAEQHTPWMAKLATVLAIYSPARLSELQALEASGQVEKADSLREDMARLNPKATMGATPLHIAISMGHVQCLHELLLLGAETQATNSQGMASLQLAASLNQVAALQELVQWGVDIETCDGFCQTAMHYASAFDSLECLQLLMEAGARVAATCWQGGTPLHCAAVKGSAACARVLLAAGAGKDAAILHGESPLHLAAYQGHSEVIRALVEAGADIEMYTESDYTPVHLAAAGGQVEAALALAAAGANLEARARDAPPNDCTPAQVAAAYGHTSVVAALAAAGADINRQDESALTCLHHFFWQACTTRVPDAPKRLQQLLDAGASVQLACATWPTPLDMMEWVEQVGNCELPEYIPELIRMLAAAGCPVLRDLESQEGDVCKHTVERWLSKLGPSTESWPPKLSSSALSVGRVLLQCAAAERGTNVKLDKDGKSLIRSAVRSGSAELAVATLGLFPRSELDGTIMLGAVRLFERAMNAMPHPGRGTWSERYSRPVKHFCDMAEGLLAAGCPPIMLCLPRRGGIGVASRALRLGGMSGCVGSRGGRVRMMRAMGPAYSIPRGTYHLRLTGWARMHLREVITLAASGLRWSPANHHAFPPAFRAAAIAMLHANHRGVQAQAVALETAGAAELPEGRPHATCCAAAGTAARMHLPQEVVLLILARAAHPPSAWVPQLQP